MKHHEYLTNLDESYDTLIDLGIAKTLLVRKLTCNLKHLRSELHVFKRLPEKLITNLYEKLNYNESKHSEMLMHKERKIWHITRTFKPESLDKLVKTRIGEFYSFLEICKTAKPLVVLDFDGVVTNNEFRQFHYERIYDLVDGNVVICSANPTVSNDYFDKRNIKRPKEIYACKGKWKKISRLAEINKKHAIVFYIDNEREYLDYAFLFNAIGFHYSKNSKNKYGIKYRSLKSK